MGRDLLTSWKAGLAEVKGEIENVDRNFANGIRTEYEGTTESRGSVMAVRTAMEAGKVEGTSDAIIIKGEMCKLGQGMTELTETLREIDQVKETQKLKEVKDELHKIKK